MMRTTGLILILALALPPLSGCAKQLKRIETRVDEVSSTTRRLEKEQRALQTTLERVDAREAQREEDYAERRAELEAQLLALDRAVRRMDARAEEQDALLRRISAALDIVARQPQASPGSNPDGSATPPTGDGEGMTPVTGADESAQPPVSTSQESEGPSSQSAGTDVFDAAFADYTRGSYTLARQGFEEVLERFPGSELADDASYWIAETYYAQGDYRQALVRFEQLERDYAGGDMLAPTLLKMGYCLLELDQPSRAADAFRRLQREHPDSDEALIAEHKLSTLGNQR
jgi:tol-pal system protein YbgF